MHRGARTPEDRVRAERRELGVDHALVGGVLARRWGLPKSIASTIERHHSEELAEEARAVFAETVVPRDFDVIEVPFAERGAPALVKAGARPVSSVGDGANGASGSGG